MVELDHLTKRQKDAIARAAENRLRLGSACDYVLTIGGRDYTPLVEHLRVLPQDGPAVVLEGTVGARLPKDLEDEECVVEHVVGGERIESYLGEIDSLSAKGYRSTFLAATASRHAEKTPLGEGPDDDPDFFSARPSDALYQIASILADVYRGTEIPVVAKPAFTRTNSREPQDGFSWDDYVSEAYEAIRDQTGLAAEDTPLSVLTGRLETAVSGDSEPLWVFEEGVDFGDGELSVEARKEGRYARVVSWRELEDGTHRPLEEAPVDHSGRKVHRRATYLLEHAEDDPEAYRATFRKAQEFADNTEVLSWPCVYPPFWLKRGDPVLVKSREITLEGTWKREYRARLASNAPDLHARTGQLEAVGRLASEVFEKRAEAAAGARADAVRAPYGLDHLERAYFDASLPWVRDVGDYVELDTEVAAFYGVTITEEAEVVAVGS